MRKNLKPLTITLVAICLLALMPVRAAAWGKDGHSIVARIAWARLDGTPAHARVKQLLGNNQGTFVEASAWADQVRRRHPYTYADNWHFVSIPRSRDRFEPAAHCGQLVNVPSGQTGVPAARVNDCVIGALDYLRGVLRDPSASMQRQTDALKFVIHFIGDLHQPLHCSEDRQFRNHKNTAGERYGDRGGNYKFVCFFDECFEPRYNPPRNKNLHSTWDSYMIAHKRLLHRNTTGKTLSEAAYATSLLARESELFTAEEIAALGAGTPVAWAEEAHAEAKQFAYTEERFPRVTKANPHVGGQQFKYRMLGREYYDENISRVDRQLLRAGIRLAAFLRDALE